MKPLSYLKTKIASGNANELLSELYGYDGIQSQIHRYVGLIDSFSASFPDIKQATFFSSPGRTEIGGNHTDHNAGRILAAAVSLDIVALAAPASNNKIKVFSVGYDPVEICIDELEPRSVEKFTSASLVRGVCNRMKMLGHNIGSFNACISGQVPKGSGLSSSAAYEVLIANILNSLLNKGKLNVIELAQIAQYAENNFFGKPCGLMDQTTCAVGGMVTIDFKDFENPIIRKVNVDFAKAGHKLVIIDTGGNHADMNDDYIALENEMKSVAKALGKNVLREVDETLVLNSLSKIRAKTGDRAVLRALHFFSDDQRVVQQVDALEKDDFNLFLKLVNESALSSWMLCQNCYSHKYPHEQGISIALTLSNNILNGKGACRVHGGGFAGTIQAFVPMEIINIYESKIREVFGPDCCHIIAVRNPGCKMIDF